MIIRTVAAAWLLLGPSGGCVCSAAAQAPANPMSTAARAQTTEVRTPPFDQLARMFDYDPKAPLDAKEDGVQELQGALLHNITYASPKGGRVTAILVTPIGKGPFAGIRLSALGARRQMGVSARGYRTSQRRRGLDLSGCALGQARALAQGRQRAHR